MAFGGNSLRLSGNGILELGLLEGSLLALDRGRIVNSVDHTILTSGIFRHGSIIAAALTNEGTIAVDDYGDLKLELIRETHFNYGAIRAMGAATLSVRTFGIFINHGLIETPTESLVI